MIALDTSFLLDYLEGVEPTADFIDERDDEPLFAPSLSLFEVYRGAARVGGADGIERAVGGLGWLEPLPLTESAAREAALVETELREVGEPVNLGDTLIAGVCRHEGASIVTRDDHFARVPDLDVIAY